MKKAAVIISFYNNLDFLKHLLAGFSRQTEKSFEVIISDDGSKEAIVTELHKIIPNYNFNIKHVWHEDNGWQKNKILNKAIGATEAPYLIFLDGDCIPHRSFVEEHLNNAEDQTILTGRRVYLTEKFSKTLTEKYVREGGLENIVKHIKNKTWQWENGIYLGKSPLRHLFNKKIKGVLGCNFSTSKQAMLMLNGFDERYKYPTVGEDVDIEYRLRNANHKVKTLKFLAIQYHLWHKKLTREMTPQNMKILEEAIENKTIFTAYGIDKSK